MANRSYDPLAQLAELRAKQIDRLEERCAEQQQELKRLRMRVGSLTGLLKVLSEELEEVYGRLARKDDEAARALEAERAGQRALHRDLEAMRELHRTELARKDGVVNGLQRKAQLLTKLWRRAVKRALVERQQRTQVEQELLAMCESEEQSEVRRSLVISSREAEAIVWAKGIWNELSSYPTRVNRWVRGETRERRCTDVIRLVPPSAAGKAD